MKDLQKTDTFFDRDSGDIVCVTRVVPDPVRDRDTKYYGMYCTGPKSTEVDGNGNDLEFGFCQSQVFEHDDVHTDPRKAFNEAIYGNHVAHCAARKGTRRVAIRPREDGRFNITCSENKLGFTRMMHSLTERQARHLVNMFLTGDAVQIDHPYYLDHINQADREIVIQVDTLAPTRVRIDYEMPNSGYTEAWRKCVQVDEYIFIETAN